jgi:hypothetical protein
MPERKKEGYLKISFKLPLQCLMLLFHSLESPEASAEKKKINHNHEVITCKERMKNY